MGQRERKRIKVLTLNCMVDEGSTSKIINDIENVASDKYEFYQCYQIGSKSHGKKYLVSTWWCTKFYFLLSRVVGLKYGVGNIPTYRLIRYIEHVAPDIVHIHCPNFYSINLYWVFSFLKKRKYPVVITNHAEFFYTGNCAHAHECEGYKYGCKKCVRIFDEKYRYIINRTATEWKRMKRAFSGACNFVMVAVSPWQKVRIMNSPITKDMNITIIENGVNTSVFKKKSIDEEKCVKWKSSGRKIILNVTSNFSDDPSEPKGGYYLLQVAKRMPNYTFLVAGNINVREYREIPSNVVLLGNIKDQCELADYYNLADLTIVTSKRETFGMSCAESMLCGTPVVGFRSGGTETIAIEEYSEFVDFADIDGLISVILKWGDKKDSISEDVAKSAKKQYSLVRMAQEYVALYEQMLT